MSTKNENTPASVAQDDSRDDAPVIVEPAAGEVSSTLTVVGIGASAGGLRALEAFLSSLPADTGMAFVVVQHLAPDHESQLSHLLKRSTAMQVCDVEDGIEVEPNSLYVIPPGFDMALVSGRLRLFEPVAAHGRRLPIDFFFRSLAEEHHERTICLILSGTGSDGVEGIRAVKSEGGLVIAQSPDSADYDGMPRSAIATGLVDHVLAASEIGAELVAYAKRTVVVDRSAVDRVEPRVEELFEKLFVLLLGQTGHDFSHYKRNTIARRVERRMAVHRLARLDDYVTYAQQSRDEVTALFRDLLIGVTSFFRESKAFEALVNVAIPALFAGKSERDAVRIWVPGCSTGEEAYSIAILLLEHMESIKKRFDVHVFATDIDRHAIDIARAGIYPSNISADLSHERLTRHFTPELDGNRYCIRKTVRDMLIFSEHDLIRSPPFSRLDLVSCRNLLIYLDGELQKKIIPLFHYALRPSGFLFLGTSETTGDFGQLFAVLDRESKVYQRKDQARHSAAQAWRVTPASRSTAVKPFVKPGPGEKKPGIRETVEGALLDHFKAVGVLVDVRGDVLYVHGRAGNYLEPAQGAATNNVLKMAREGLRYELTNALNIAASQGEPVKRTGLRVRTNGHFTTVELTVRPLVMSPTTTKTFLVIFEVAAEVSPPLAPTDSAEPSTVSVAALREELAAKEDSLNASNEELETSNEELRSANEELQSTNEELQSTNEELHTSKEELQSVNEELATVNAELEQKVIDLSRAGNDMSNFLAGTGIGTVFLDNDLRIQRFTPAATQVLNLIATDVGRPVGHLVSNLTRYDRLVEDVEHVMSSLVPTEVEVESKSGAWFSIRIRPYRTLDNVIEGTVISFIDITEIVHARAAHRDWLSLHRLAVVARDGEDAITVEDLSGRILAWNPAATRLYGWTEEEALTMNARDMIPEDARADAATTVTRLIRPEALTHHKARRLTKGGEIIEVSLTASALVNDRGNVYAFAKTERVVSAPKPAIEAAHESGRPTDEK